MLAVVVESERFGTPFDLVRPVPCFARTVPVLVRVRAALSPCWIFDARSGVNLGKRLRIDKGLREGESEVGRAGGGAGCSGGGCWTATV